MPPFCEEHNEYHYELGECYAKRQRERLIRAEEERHKRARIAARVVLEGMHGPLGDLAVVSADDLMDYVQAGVLTGMNMRA